MIKVIVGSTNPVKIDCIRDAFKQAMPKETIDVRGEQSPSGVNDQPMTDNETYIGAHNRAAYVKEQFLEADYWAGVEGGIDYHETDMEAFAWIVILSKEKMGKARTASFMLPAQIKELVEEGVELGIADDQVFKRQNSKQNNGAVGILTNDVIDRKGYYQHAAVLALIPFLQEGLYL